MEYYETWFGKKGFIIHSGHHFGGRTYWIRPRVEMLTGNLVSTFHENDDGSIDVLGVETLTMYGVATGHEDKSSLQRSLAEHAERLKNAGATIVKQTKNTLKARHGNETFYVTIS